MSISSAPRDTAQPSSPETRPAIYIAQRHDGWTSTRQIGFLVALDESRSVTRAAAAVGMSVAGLYRLRAHPDAQAFVAAWDAILAGPREQPAPDAAPPTGERVETVFRMGKPVGIRRRPDARRLTARLAHLDRLLGDG